MKFELFEVEDRPVAVDVTGQKGRAWVWRDGSWRDAPGLVFKSAFEGERLSPAEFALRFPAADFRALPSLGSMSPERFAMLVDLARQMSDLDAALSRPAKLAKSKKAPTRRHSTEFELFEVEYRPVAVDVSGPKGRAWVWRAGRWGDAPGLVLKSALEGEELSPSEFAARFPAADLAAIPLKGDNVRGSSQRLEPLTAAALLGPRRFAELSESERKQYGQLREREAGAQAQAIADNLNRQVMARKR